MYRSLFIISIMLSFCWGCEEPVDPCIGVDCGPNADCVSGSEVATCVCEDGWEEDAAGQCLQYKFSNFLGTFSVAETCLASLMNPAQEFTQSYTLEIVSLSEPRREARLSGLGGRTCQAENKPLGVNVFMPNQAFVFTQSILDCNDPNITYIIQGGSGTFAYQDRNILVYTLEHHESGVMQSRDVCRATLTPE